MPMLSAVYGLRWEHILAMPAGELREYLDQMPDVQRKLCQVEMVRYKDG